MRTKSVDQQKAERLARCIAAYNAAKKTSIDDEYNLRTCGKSDGEMRNKWMGYHASALATSYEREAIAARELIAYLLVALK